MVKAGRTFGILPLELHLEIMKKQFLKLLCQEIRSMLVLFNVTPKKYACYFNLLDQQKINSNWCEQDYWYNVLHAWIKLLHQFIPVKKYKVDILAEMGLPADQQKSWALLQRKLLKGENVNDMALKFLPQLKESKDLDMLEEQSRVRHFHLPVNGDRQDRILFAECDFSQDIILIHGLANHHDIKNYNIHNKRFSKTLIKIMHLPVSKNPSIPTKEQEYEMRKCGITPIIVHDGVATMRYPLNATILQTLMPGIYRDLQNHVDVIAILNHARGWILENC